MGANALIEFVRSELKIWPMLVLVPWQSPSNMLWGAIVFYDIDISSYDGIDSVEYHPKRA